MTEQAKVPAIRFAGFTDPWEQRKLGELEKDATLYMGRGRVISTKDMSNTPGTFPVYSSSALDNGRMGAYGKYMFNQELITWSIDGGGAVFYRRKHRFSVTNVSGYIAVNPEKISCKFLAYAMSLAHSRIKFDYTVKAHPSVIRSLYTMGIPISLQEQQVIGSFFSRLDHLITLHQRKYDKLVVFKKSMLEKMFPKDGESVPEIRFAGFTDPWEQRKFGDVTDSFSGGTPDGSHASYYGGSIPFIRSAEINSDKTELFLTEKGLDNSSAKIVERGTVLYALYGATSGEVGIAAIKGAINQAILALSPHTGNDPLFLASWLRREKARIVDTYLQGGQGNLSGSIVKELSFALPQQKEQQVIGSFFSHLDNLITLHQRKLELLQNIKKSLLDKMFV